jgi:hypothetical protein
MRPPHEHRAPAPTDGEAALSQPSAPRLGARLAWRRGGEPSPWIAGTWTPETERRRAADVLEHPRRSVVVAGCSPLGRSVWLAARRDPDLLCTRELLDERLAVRVVAAEVPDFAVFCDVVDDRDVERFARTLREAPESTTRGIVLYSDGEATVCVSPGLPPGEEDIVWRLTEARRRR